jgi:hypothetical protein
VLSERDDISPDDDIWSFGEDARGELYVVTSSSVYRIDDTEIDRCGDVDACAPFVTRVRACVSDAGECRAGTRERTCLPTCTWSGWSACDDTETACGCGAAIVAGTPESFTVTGRIDKLVHDPKRCLVYGLNADGGDELIVLDAIAREELTRIALPQAATDIDLSPNGQWLVAAHQAAYQVSFIVPRGSLVPEQRSGDRSGGNRQGTEPSSTVVTLVGLDPTPSP